MQGNTLLSRATVEDAEGITDFSKSVTAGLDCFTKSRRQEISDKKDPFSVSDIISLQGSYVLVAKGKDGAIQATMGAVPINSAFSRSNLQNTSGFWTKWILVAKNMRRLGLAQTMISDLQDHAQRQGYKFIEAVIHHNNAPSLAFFAANGFENRHPLLVDGEFHLLHRKKLMQERQKPEPAFHYF